MGKHSFIHFYEPMDLGLVSEKPMSYATMILRKQMQQRVYHGSCSTSEHIIETEGNIFLRVTITHHEESFFVVAIDEVGRKGSTSVAAGSFWWVSSQAIDQDEG
jgi:hypothetical protein